MRGLIWALAIDLSANEEQEILHEIHDVLILS